MSLRVAFDLDGTLADMASALRKEAIQLFGESTLARQVYQNGTEPKGGDTAEAVPILAELHLTARQQMQLWDRVREVNNFWLGLPEAEPGIVARIWRTATGRQWEVIFLTTRPPSAGETTQLQTQRWLQMHGFPLPSVFVVHGSRGKVAEALTLDILVDDRPENCLDVAVESRAKPIMIWPGDPQNVPAGAKRLGVRVTSSIAEAVDIIEHFDDLLRERGVVKSIKKLFGKEEPV